MTKKGIGTKRTAEWVALFHSKSKKETLDVCGLVDLDARRFCRDLPADECFQVIQELDFEVGLEVLLKRLHHACVIRWERDIVDDDYCDKHRRSISCVVDSVARGRLLQTPSS